MKSTETHRWVKPFFKTASSWLPASSRLLIPLLLLFLWFQFGRSTRDFSYMYSYTIQLQKPWTSPLSRSFIPRASRLWNKFPPSPKSPYIQPSLIVSNNSRIVRPLRYISTWAFCLYGWLIIKKNIKLFFFHFILRILNFLFFSMAFIFIIIANVELAFNIFFHFVESNLIPITS